MSFSVARKIINKEHYIESRRKDQERLQTNLKRRKEEREF